MSTYQIELKKKIYIAHIFVVKHLVNLVYF